MNPGTNVTITTPPFCGISARTSSGTFRGTSQRARADECEKMTGARVTRSASCIVAGATCDRSTSMPSRFISRTTSSPNAVSPSCSGCAPAASAHGRLALCVSVM